MNPESFEKKLHIVRDVENRPRYEDLELIRRLEKDLSRFESFVGLAPFGSVVGGYGDSDSDIDVYILYDRSPDSENKVNDCEQLMEYNTVEWRKELQQKEHKFVDFYFYDVNPDNLVKSARQWIKGRGHPGDHAPHGLSIMTRVVTGKKIDQYRQMCAKKLEEFDQRQRQMISDSILRCLLTEDVLSLSKRQKRMPELSAAEHQKILTDREKMWRDRIAKIWHLNNE